ncbi:peptidyl-prolyl cis-trans isomerase FKBP35-like [Aethina tumida]|uniref:peptidyl-prolyl cis-trans isomerase FKBP35-like n=1 Tax=Aethina tumida TaxID=116153 RepID=UPI00096B222F|nr:peptidyl-prolyl cis-trans isomerase FKBP35-like [Aethina tumida]
MGNVLAFFNKIRHQKDTKGSNGWIDLLGCGGILKKVIKEGQPNTKPEDMQVCRILCAMFLDNGTKVHKLERQKIYIGDLSEIPGLDFAVASMNIHERCLLKLTPKFGYGSKGLPGVVPENANLVCDVILRKVGPKVNMHDISSARLLFLWIKKRKYGNFWYKQGEYDLAGQCYVRAMKYLECVKLEPKQMLQNKTLYDLASAQAMMGSYNTAIEVIDTILSRNPNNVKALVKKARIYKVIGDYRSALNLLWKAKDIAPHKRKVRKEINNIYNIIERKKLQKAVKEILAIAASVVAYKISRYYKTDRY